MISNNGYIRGEYAVIGKTAFAGTKLSDYKLNDDEFTKHYLTTKEYVDSKIKVNSLSSIKSGYTHEINEQGKITAYSITTGPDSDSDGKPITKTESLISGGGYIIKNNEDEYNIGIIENVDGTVGYQEKLEIGQQLYSELDNQIYTLIQFPYTNPESSVTTITKILVPDTITTTIDSFITKNTVNITFDKLFNDNVNYKLTISDSNFSSTLSSSLIYTETIEIPIIQPYDTNYSKYINYMLMNNMEENVGKIISLSSYSGIVSDGINLLLFETSSDHLECMIDENNIIKLTFTKGTGQTADKYENNSSSITSATGTYYLIDYYNKHVIKVTLPLSEQNSIQIDDANIGTGNVYVKDLSLLAELNISKSLRTNYESYTITIRALSSPKSQHITPWVIETPLILNTYKQ